MMCIRLFNRITEGLVVGGALCFALSSPASAQVQSTQTVEHGPATQNVKIERGEVVYVSGRAISETESDGTVVLSAER